MVGRKRQGIDQLGAIDVYGVTICKMSAFALVKAGCKANSSDRRNEDP